MPTWGGVIDEIAEEEETSLSSFDKVRRKYLDEVYDCTDREPLLYSSGWTELNINSPQFEITETDVQGFMETVSDIDADGIDLILHSPGGSPEVAEQIVSYLRAKFDDIRIIVPQAAMSAATLICCAADDVLMGHHSAVGPTDPKMLIPTETGHRWVAAQSIIDQFEEVDETAQSGGEIVHYTPILSQYDPGLLNEARDAVDLSESLAEAWAEEYMFNGDPNAQSKASELATFLSDRSNFRSHNRRISREWLVEETDMNVTSLEDNQELQENVLSVFHAVTATHNHQQYAKIIENRHGGIYGRRVQQ